MKKSKTTTIHRMDPKKGNFVTMSRDILTSTELTDKAKVLLMLMLNNADNWNISVCYYGNLLGWGNTTLSNTVKNLVENGYLITNKHSKGKGMGFLYTYVVSEFGNLNPNKTKLTNEEVKEFLDEQKQQLPEEPFQPEIPQNETETSNVIAEAITEIKEEIVQEELDGFHERLNEVLSELIKGYRLTDDFLIKVIDYYRDEVNKDNTKILKYTIELMNEQITNSIVKNESKAMKKIEDWIEIYNDRGTIAQKKTIKTKALLYFKDKTKWKFTLEEVIEKDVSTRLLYLKSSVIDANREYDSRFQD